MKSSSSSSSLPDNKGMKASSSITSIKPQKQISNKSSSKINIKSPNSTKDKVFFQEDYTQENSTIYEQDDETESIVSDNESVQSELCAVNAKRNRMLNYLIFLCESELFLEKLRQKVCSYEDFEPYAIFQRFNRSGNKTIQGNDIRNFMSSFNENIDHGMIKNLIQFYNVSKSGSLSFVEFMSIVLTTEDDELRTKVSLRPTYKVENEEFLSLNLEVSIGKLLFQLITYLDKLDEFRSEMERDFNLEEFLEAFNYLNKRGSADLENDDIISFLREQGYNPSQILSKNIIKNFKGPSVDLIEEDEENIIGYDSNGNPIYKTGIDKTKFVRFFVPNMNKDAIKHAFDILEKSKIKVPVRTKREFKIRQEWMEIFKSRVEPEKEIEYCKQDLTMCKDFSAYDMFSLINSDQNEYISMTEFVDSLKELGVLPFKEELYLFFRRHAKNKKKGMKQKEFKMAILPNQKLYDKVAKGRIKVSKSQTQILMKDILVPDTLMRFKKLMMSLLKFELKIEKISLRLAKLAIFSYEEFFELLDTTQQGFVTLQNMKDVFSEHKIDITDKELSFLFERLDCKEKDEKITYIEFINEIQPHLPKNLIARRFTSSQRQKQVNSMANIIDSELNLKSRGNLNNLSNSQPNVSIPSLSQLQQQSEKLE